MKKNTQAKKPAVAKKKDAAKVEFDATKTYRIHFRNGHSGEYLGQGLCHTLPFDMAEVTRVEEIG